MRADDVILAEAKKRWRICVEDGDWWRKRAYENLLFCDPENQWPQEVKRDRERDKRPCMTFDRTNPFVRQVVNEMRQTKPSISINPVDSGADVDTAEVLQGIVRHIEYSSNADVAYDRAAESQVKCGFGFYRVLADYITPGSFDQDLIIKSVPNPFMIYLDPSSTEPDGSDANFAFCAADYSRDDYIAEFGNSELAKMDKTQWSEFASKTPGWMDEEGAGCRVVEYWVKESEEDTLYKLESGNAVYKSEYDKNPTGEAIVAQRKVRKTVVVCYKITGFEVLEKTPWAGTYIPIIPQYGNEFHVNGRKYYTGLVDSMKDAARLHNIMRSAEVETIALTPKAPWVGPQGFRGNMEHEWANCNNRTYSTLEYVAFDSQQRPLPPPTRVFPEPASQAITLAIQGTEQELKAVTGMYDPSLGNRQESGQSGIAIRSLQQQGQTGNFHFVDNASRSRRHLGRILLELIPIYYDTPRIVRIIGEDDVHKMVMVNGPNDDGKIFKLGMGRYDVTVSTGPSFQTRRQENLAIMSDLVKAAPQIGAVGSDMLVSQIDAPFAKELAERLKKTLPPGIAEDKDKPQQAQIPPEIQQQMQALMQQHEMLVKALNESQSLLQDEARKMQFEREKAELEAKTKKEVAYINGQAEIAKVVAQVDAKRAEALLNAHVEMSRINAEPATQETEDPEQPEAPETEGGE